nr:LytTR family DNA-binding domain-containing protein [Burkholderia anthina]
MLTARPRARLVPRTPASRSRASLPTTVGVKDATRFVAVDDVLYFQAADKYTEVVTVDQRLVIRTPLKELMPRLDSERFAQVHRGVIVAYAAIDRVERDLPGRLRIRVHGQREYCRSVARMRGCSGRCDGCLSRRAGNMCVDSGSRRALLERLPHTKQLCLQPVANSTSRKARAETKKGATQTSRNPFSDLVPAAGLEPAT